MRTTHLLSATKGDSLPAAFIAFDSRLAESPNSESDTGVSLRCEQVGVRHVRFDRPAGPQLTDQLLDADEFHRVLWVSCRPGTATWLVGRDVYRQLVACRFFDRINGADWVLQPAEDAAGEDNGQPRKKVRGGFVVLEPRVTILVVTRPGGGTLHVVDLSNYAVDSLPGWSTDQAANAALVADWIIAWRAWLAQHGAGTWRYTLGSQAHYAFRRAFLEWPVVVHGHEQALALEGDSLYGGRAECFRRGKVAGPIYHLDARSLYGAVARDAQVPAVLLGYGDRLPELGGLTDCCLIADVSVDTPCPSVPYRDPGRKLTIWPIGKFRTSLCGPELELIRDRVTAVHRVAWYDPAPIFRRWATACWDWRVEAERSGNRVIAGQIKVFSQLLYGKFSQRFRGWSHVPGEPTRMPWALWWSWDEERSAAVAWRAVAGRVERHIDAGWTDQACPAVGAWISSLARVWLWRAICAAGWDDVYYCDTDSIFCSAAGFHRLVAAGYRVGPDLGDLRLEGIYSECEFRGIKHYTADGRLVCAGLDQRSRVARGVEPITTACGHRRAPISLHREPAGPWGKEYQHGRTTPTGEIEPWDLSNGD